MNKEYKGFIAPQPITPDQWVLGGSNTSLFPITKEDGNWTDTLSSNEKQNIRGIETYNCVGFNTLACVENLMSYKFGGVYNFSDRWLGIVAGTKAPGNDPQVVSEAIRKYGLIPESMLPFSDDIQNIDEYYSFKGLTKEQIEACYAEGRKWLETYNFQHKWVYKENQPLEEKINNMKVGIKSSPLGIAVYAWASDARDVYISMGDPNHWTCVYNIEKFLEVIDTYEPFRKLVEQNIVWCKMYSIEKKSPITEEQKVGLLAQLKKLLEWLGILQKQLDEVIKKNPMDTVTNLNASERIYEISKSLLKKRLTLDPSVPKETGCAQCVSYILKECGYAIPKGGISGTYTLYEWLNKNFYKTDTLEKGTIVIAVTGTGNGKVRGHVWVVLDHDGKDWVLASNSSKTGLLDTDWKYQNAVAYYKNVGKLKMVIFKAK